jgi:hypothetical protein
MHKDLTIIIEIIKYAKYNTFKMRLKEDYPG